MVKYKMPKERITKHDVDTYKREILEESVLVTPKAAAAMLSCSQRTIHRLVQEGELAGYTRTPRAKGLRLLAAELREYVKSIKVDIDEWRE